MVSLSLPPTKSGPVLQEWPGGSGEIVGRTGFLLEAAEAEERGADGIVGEGNKVTPAPWLGDVKKI